MVKDPETNYSVQSMNEIVFENRNKAYGAFFLRSLYRKNLLKALLICCSAFILATITPSIIRKLGWTKSHEAVSMDTMNIILQPPPSLNSMEPPAPVSKAEEVAAIEELIEMQASDKQDIIDTIPTKTDLTKKENDKLKTDTSGSTASQDPSKGEAGGGKSGEGKIWNKVQQLPEFMGGEEAYFRFMNDNMKYPSAEMEDGIEGVAKIYFVVNEDGSIDNVKVMESSGNKNLDAEAVRLIKMQPRYRPGRQHGNPVRVSCVIAITFRL